MGIDDWLIGMKKDGATHRGADAFDDIPGIGIHDICQSITFFHPVIDVGPAEKKSGRLGLDIYQSASFNESGNIAVMTAVGNDLILIQETQYRIYGFLSAGHIDTVCGTGIGAFCKMASSPR